MKSIAVALSALSVLVVGGAGFMYSNCVPHDADCVNAEAPAVVTPAVATPAVATPAVKSDCGDCPSFATPTLDLAVDAAKTDDRGGCPSEVKAACDSEAKADCADKAQADCDTEDCPPEDCLPTATTKAKADDCCPEEAAQAKAKAKAKSKACCPEVACDDTASN